MPAAFRFRQCSAVITGASSGLGAEFARQLAPEARCVLLAARREDALEEVRQELLGLNPALRVLICACDVSSDAGRAALLASAASSGMKPNLLINNAGVGDYGSFLSADEARLRGQIDLNITALVLLTHSLVPLMERSAEAPAAVLNVASLAGTLPMPDLAVYAATKAFVISFSEALRVELASEDVIVSAVCPGPTPTNFGKNARRPDGTDTDRSGQDLLRIPPARVVGAGLEALSHGRACVYPGAGVSAAARLFRLMPRVLMRWSIERRHVRGRAKE
jgi:short-subunit dehydrogenase